MRGFCSRGIRAQSSSVSSIRLLHLLWPAAGLCIHSSGLQRLIEPLRPRPERVDQRSEPLDRRLDLIARLEVVARRQPHARIHADASSATLDVNTGIGLVRER